MTSTSTRMWCASIALVFLAMAVGAQERHAASDPRVGLKPGFRNAGVAARNMELVASVPNPAGFFDPTAPAGLPTPPERPPAPATPPADESAEAPTSPGSPPPPDPAPAAPSTLMYFANSDLAFSGGHVIMGSFNGFTAYDIKNPKKPKLAASIVCPGGQGDVSVYGHLLFMSVEQPRGRLDCGLQGVQDKVSTERFRGIRIFDITDLARPKQVADVQTCRGSHTHTLVVDPRDAANVYLYGSGTGAVRAGEELAGCSGRKPEEDANTSLFSIDVIQVPLNAPAQAHLVNQPRIFADTTTGAIAGLWQGGDHGPDTQRTSATNQCHDITVFPEIGLAAGACSGNGILIDISDPVHPVRLDAVSDKNFAYWHSATFNNDGTKVIFTDEWGGGTRPRCRATDPATWGADAIFDIADRKLRFAGYFKMPAAQTAVENCVAHNGSLIPVPGRDIMAQGWYQGGVSIFDFTDSAHPFEIAFFDRGPIDAKTLITAGYWAAYWYNGLLYGSEIGRGLDVFKLTPSEYLSENEIAAATLVRTEAFNPQAQTRLEWPANPLVARAYLDQLTRSQGIQPARAQAIRSALDQAEDIRTGKEKGAAALVDRLDALATELDRDADAARDPDAKRLRSLGSAIKANAARMR